MSFINITNKKKSAVLTIIILVIFGFSVFGLTSCRNQSGTVEQSTKESTELKTIEAPPTTDSASEGQEPSEGEAEITEVTLYFPDNMARHLVAEKRQISSSENIAQDALVQLFKGPKKENLIPVTPSGLEPPEVTIVGNLARVNFSKKVSDLYPKGSTGENMFIFSIVNTLVDSTGASKVRFYIEGEPAHIEGSNYDLSQHIFEKNKSIISKN